MTFNERVQAWQAFGQLIERMSTTELEQVARRAELANPWFTLGSVRKALEGIKAMLDPSVMTQWLSDYQIQDSTQSKVVGLVLAGNLPLVGFHDLLCVTLAGHKALIKPSSQDEVLLKWMISELGQIAPQLANQFKLVERLADFDAVIATGSNNSSRYFEYYFGKVPNIIRKNRRSVALLHGNESVEELVALGHDVFTYFGHGCRNVSQLLVPAGYNFPHLLDQWHDPFHEIIFHNKYANNYEYNRAVYLINSHKLFDTGYLLVKESDALQAPLGVINYMTYQDATEVKYWLNEHEMDIQVIVGDQAYWSKTNTTSILPFGSSQEPMPWDYSDGVDTMAFLMKI